MKKIVLFILFASQIFFAQNDQKSIELPDFVITGRQSVDVQTASKRKPSLISTLSEDFLIPQYTPEELDLFYSSNPKPIQPKITSDDYFTGSLYVGGGRYTLPIGRFNLTNSFGNYLLSANLWGSNISEYIPNAGLNTSGVSLNNYFFIDTNSDFLPGTSIKLNGKYSRDSYKFFASNIPAFERKLGLGELNFTFSNTYIKWINFGFKLDAHLLKFRESSLDEKVFDLDGLIELKLNRLSVGVNGSFKKQLLSNNPSLVSDYNYFSINSYVKLNPTNSFNLKFGVDYSSNDFNNFFAPFAKMQLAIEKNLVFQIEYKPHTKHFTLHDFVTQNYYMVSRTTDNVFTKVKSDLNGLFKYEFENYFSTSLFGHYSKSESFLYFEDLIQPGFFDIRTSPDVQSIQLGMNILYNTHLFGYFISEIKYNSVKDNLDFYIPYQSKYKFELIYGYDFSFGLGARIKLNSLIDTHTNITNTNKIDSFHDLSIGLSYKLFNTLSFRADFQNILNRANFVLKQYQEKPFDVILGIEYRW
ncbi:MAG: hypothetical protein FJ214_08510 [Ignavibacteria bacterium]|nr:hypothetical protein [Ignavibacteria bacterium]